MTDPSFSRRLKDSLAHGEDKLSDMELLKSGRHFRGEDNCKIIVGRDKADNKRLLQTADKEDLIFLVKDFPGPVVVLRGAKNDNCVKRAAGLAVRYSDSQSGKTAVVYGSKREGFNEEITVEGDLSRGNPV